jgi:hypothetical protein
MISKKCLNNLFATILCITPLIIIPFNQDYFYYPKIAFIYIIASILGIIWFSNRENAKVKICCTEKTILAYTILVILSTIFSINIERSIWGRINREEGLFAIIVYIFLLIVAKR